MYAAASAPEVTYTVNHPPTPRHSRVSVYSAIATTAAQIHAKVRTNNTRRRPGLNAWSTIIVWAEVLWWQEGLRKSNHS